MAISTDEIKILVKAETDKAIKGLKNVQKQSKKTAFSFNDIIKGAVGFNGVTTAINLVGTAVKDAVKTVIQFDSAIANAASVSKVTREELRQLALEAGRNTKFSATEAADALFFLGSAGLNTAEVMADTLTPSLNLAAAANMGIAETTDIVVNNLKVFQKEGLKAAEVTDIIAQTQRSANTDFRQLSEALKVAGADAALSGIKFKDLNVLIAGLANQGIKGSEAGIKLRQTFVRLRGGISSVDKTLAKYNITQEEINNLLSQDNGAIKLFERLRSANISTSDATKIFGVRQGAVFALIKNGIGDLRRLNEEIIGSGEAYKGAAEEIAAQKLDTIEGQLQLLKSAWDDIVLTISGEAGITDSVKDALKIFVDFVREVGKVVRLKPVLNGIRFVLDLIVLNFKLLKSTVAIFIRSALIGFEPLITFWEFFGRIILSIGEFLLSVKDKFLGFVRDVIDFARRIIKPLTAPFIVLAKVVAGLVKRFIQPFFDAILEGIKVVLTSIQKFGKEIQNFLGDKTPKFIQDGLKKLDKITKTTFNNLGKRLSANVRGIGKEVRNFTNDAIKSIRNLFDFSEKKSKKTASSIQQDQAGLTENFKMNAAKRKAATKKESDEAVEAFKNIVSKLQDLGNSLGQQDVNVANFVNGLINAVKSAKSPLEAFVNTVAEVATLAFTNVIQSFRTVRQNQVQFLQDQITQIEAIELEASRQRIQRMEMERDMVLERIETESAAAKELTQILAAEEEERFNNLSEEEKKKETLRKQIAAEKLAEEQKFNKEIRKEKERQFKLEQELAIAQIKFDRAKTIMDIERQFWAPWDGGKRRELINKVTSLSNQQIQLVNSRIPSFRGGVENFRGGVAKVHQDEVVNLPAGADVIPASQVSQFATTNSTNTLTIGQIVMNEVSDARTMLQNIAKEAEDMGFNILSRT